MTSPCIYCWIANDPKTDAGSLTASVCLHGLTRVPLKAVIKESARLAGVSRLTRAGVPSQAHSLRAGTSIPHCVGPSTGLRVPGRRLPSEPASKRGAPRTEAQPVCDLVSGVTSPHSAVLCGLR